MIVTIEVIRDGVFNLLSDMERLDLIRINAPVKNTAQQTGKLSEQFAGALRLSDAQYEEYENVLRKGRTEWARDIY
jgi:hypothetical protein